MADQLLNWVWKLFSMPDEETIAWAKYLPFAQESAHIAKLARMDNKQEAVAYIRNQVHPPAPEVTPKARARSPKKAVAAVRGLSVRKRRLVMVGIIVVLGTCVWLLTRTPSGEVASPTLEQMGGAPAGQTGGQQGQPDFGVQAVQPTSQPGASESSQGDGVPNFGPAASVQPTQPVAQATGQQVYLTFAYPGFDSAGGIGLYDWLARQQGMPADAAQSTGSFACTFLAEVRGKGIVDQYKTNPNSPLTFSIMAIHPAGCQR